MKGRCYERAAIDPFLRTFRWDCESLFTNFTTAYIGKNPLNVTSADFQPFLSAARHPVPVNQSMFWTGSSSVTYNPLAPGVQPNRDIVHEYAYHGTRFWTLEDSMWGSMANSLSFCGADLSWQQQNASIFNFSYCIPYGTPGSSAAFWSAASAQFAQQAAGDVNMLGYAANRRIYRNGSDPNETASIFATIEIYNLIASQITSFTALIILNPKYPTERCNQGSVAQMQHDLTAIAGIPANKVFCQDDPDAVRHVICIDDWNSAECQFFDEVSAEGLTESQTWGVGITVGLVAGVLLVLIVMKIRDSRLRSEQYPLIPNSS